MRISRFIPDQNHRAKRDPWQPRNDEDNFEAECEASQVAALSVESKI